MRTSKLVFAALTSQQWSVKVQAARAIGTVATKLDTNIQAETQARLVNLLPAGLEGRTWAGKEALMKSLADIIKFAPDTLKAGMAVEEQDKLVEVHTGPNDQAPEFVEVFPRQISGCT